MLKSNSRQRNRFDKPIKFSVRESDKAALEHLSDRLDMEPRELARISFLRGMQLVAKHGIDIRSEHLERNTV